ncbi:MAG: flagellar hook-associated protein FlgL [Candidatus Binatia bacterium]|nr:flagellar hook-associated protein FlgL [Candidatus Binatia bacterium]
MRVTNQSLAFQVNEGLQRAFRRLAEVQEQVTSGKRINRLSDDPTGAVRVLDLHSFVASLEQYEKNISSALPFLQQSEQVLADVEEVVGRAKELALAMANDSHSGQERALAAVEVRQLFSQLLSLANTRVENRYLFGGFRNGTAPFTEGAGGVTYGGDNGEIVVQLNTSTTVVLNLIGEQVFQGVGVTGGVDLFDTLLDLEAALQSNDVTGPDGINTQIDRLERALDQVLRFRTEVGARLRTAQTAQEGVALMKLQTIGLRSRIEDADALQVYSDFARFQHAFEAALRSAAQVFQPTLLDFLR